MTRPGRRLETDERRAQLLAAGLDLFSSTSFDTVSIDEIAGRAGISRGLLYHYFPSKRDFYVAVVRLAARDLLSRLGAGSPGRRPALPPAERLRADLEAYLTFVAEHSAGFVTLLRGGVGSDPEVLAVLDETRSAILGEVLDGLGIEQPSPALLVALHGWIGAVESASLQWLTLPRESAPSADALVALFSRLLTAALGTVGAAGRS